MDTLTLSRILNALGNETRLILFKTLVKAGTQGIAVGALHDRTGVARSTLTHHIQKLMAVGLVGQRREQTTLYCFVYYDTMNDAVNNLVADCCVDEALFDQTQEAFG